MAPPGMIALPGEGRVSPALGLATTLMARGEATGGARDVLDFVMPPGSSLPPHIHHRTDEAFYVLDGELAVQLGGRAASLPAGALCFVPRGTPHGFGNAGAVPCRLLLWVTPAFGFERFLADLEQLPPGPPAPEQLLPILQRYDFEVVLPRAG
ncbi:MAG TPA: cupin domain-containing protein [Thermomicrobiales bacterium]|nr:cupin domain-containing protein [Thermomicrobiales bacterium]